MIEKVLYGRKYSLNDALFEPLSLIPLQRIARQRQNKLNWIFIAREYLIL